MRVLLDECLPLDLRHDLDGHEAHTAEWAGFIGKKNGELVEAAEAAGYEVSVELEDLRKLTGSVLETVVSIKPRQTIAVGLHN